MPQPAPTGRCQRFGWALRRGAREAILWTQLGGIRGLDELANRVHRELTSLGSSPEIESPGASRARAGGCLFRPSGRQIRTVDRERFVKRLGALSGEEMDRIRSAVALILDIEPEHCS